MERTVTVTYYGMLAEKLGLEQESLHIPAGSIDLKAYFLEKYPELSAFNFSIAVDLEYATSLSEEELPKTIDLMPPFAGG